MSSSETTSFLKMSALLPEDLISIAKSLKSFKPSSCHRLLQHLCIKLSQISVDLEAGSVIGLLNVEDDQI